MKMKTMIPEKR